MTENVEIVKGASLWHDAWKRLLRNKLAVFGMIVLALITWVLFVLPANGHITQWQVDVFPDDWTRWRDQWQFGQAGIFVLHLIGFSALISSVIGEIPEA